MPPSPENNYQVGPTETFSRALWNAAFASLAARLAAREALEADFEALIAGGTQAALDLISQNVAPQLESLLQLVADLRQQVEDVIGDGNAPNALKLGGNLPEFYLALANATGTLPAEQVEGLIDALAAVYTKTAVDLLLGGRLAKTANLNDVQDKDAAISNLGASTHGRDIIKNASAFGAILAKADAAGARAAIGVGAHDFVAGLTLSNNIADAANDIDASPGAAQAGSVYVANPAIMTKRLDAVWSAGNNGGGLDTGAKANSSTYYGHSLRKDSDGSFDIVYSLSATAPTVPAGYTKVQRLIPVMTDGSGAIRPFLQDGNEVRFRVSAGLSAYSGTADRALALLTVPLPLGIRVLGLFTGAATYEPMYSGATDQGLILADGTDINTITLGHMDGAIPNVGYVMARSYMDRVCRTNSSAQVHMGIVGTRPGTASTLVVRGFVDESIPRIGR